MTDPKIKNGASTYELDERLTKLEKAVRELQAKKSE